MFGLSIVLGVFAGFMAGLLGIGGGSVIVTGLIFLLPHLQYPLEYLAHGAIGTSFMIVLVTALAAGMTHYRFAELDKTLLKRLFLMISLGAVVGVLISRYLPDELLKLCFAILLFYAGGKLLYRTLAKHHRTKTFEAKAPNTGLFILTLLIGSFCGLLGGGVGAMMVPILMSYQPSIRHAIAMAALLNIPVALLGTIGNIFNGWQIDSLPNYSLGYIYLPAFLFITLGAVLAAPLGAKCTQKIPILPLRLIFGAFLLLASLLLFETIIFR